MNTKFCRPNCGACCIHISISSSLPGHPNGKPAGVRCVNLGDDRNCTIYGTPDFPNICQRFMGDTEMCGNNHVDATWRIIELERLTTR